MAVMRKVQTSKWKIDDAITKYNRILGEKNKHLSLTKKKVQKILITKRKSPYSSGSKFTRRQSASPE